MSIAPPGRLQGGVFPQTASDRRGYRPGFFLRFELRPRTPVSPLLKKVRHGLNDPAFTGTGLLRQDVGATPAKLHQRDYAGGTAPVD